MRNSEASEFYSGRTKEENALRKMVFMQHRHDGSSACLYGDDGEMQCGVCWCDFVRDSVEVLEEKIYNYGMRELVRLGITKITVSSGDEVKL